MKNAADILTRSKDENLISSAMARYGLMGAVCGTLVTVTLISIFSTIPIGGQVALLSTLIFIGRALGRLIATRSLNSISAVRNDHLADFHEALKRLVPPENILEATHYILNLDPHPILLQDPVWISKNLPERLVSVKKGNTRTLPSAKRQSVKRGSETKAELPKKVVASGE